MGLNPIKSICNRMLTLIVSRIKMIYKNLPGKKPGTSTKVTIGILNASQKRTNRAPFTDELMSRQPDDRQYKFLLASLSFGIYHELKV